MFTISDAQTEVTAYGDTKSISSWYVGKKYGEIWGYRTDRLYQKDDFVYENGKPVTVYALNGKEVPANTPGAKEMNKLKDPNGIYQDYFQTGTIKFGPGDVKYKDINGDGKIDAGARSVDTVTDKDDPNYGKRNTGDLEVIGNSTPRYEYGIRLGADYKGFDISIFMQGVGKRDIWEQASLQYRASIQVTVLCLRLLPRTTGEDRTNAFILPLTIWQVQIPVSICKLKTVTCSTCLTSASRILHWDIHYLPYGPRKY